MEGNQTTTTTVATGEATTTVSPIASNVTALEDYDV